MAISCCEDPSFWVYILIVVALVLFAGLMSGLTLGLMSLSVLDLEVLQKSGAPRDRKHSAKILPLVRRQHLLLCTLLLGNALAMEALPIFFDELVPAWGAILISVTLILVFGEILPQAVCSRYGLAVGATMAPIVRLLVFVFYPVAFPISKLLDLLLGKDHAVVFRRQELQTFVTMHSETAGKGGVLTDDEATIIAGALELAGKTAEDAMTPLTDTFALSIDTRLDLKTMHHIMQKGHSRVPVYAGHKSNIVGVVLVKSLLTVRPEAETPMAMVPIRRIPRVHASMPLYDILNEFQKGHSHIAAVVVDGSHAGPRASDQMMHVRGIQGLLAARAGSGMVTPSLLCDVFSARAAATPPCTGKASPESLDFTPQEKAATGANAGGSLCTKCGDQIRAGCPAQGIYSLTPESTVLTQWKGSASHDIKNRNKPLRLPLHPIAPDKRDNRMRGKAAVSLQKTSMGTGGKKVALLESLPRSYQPDEGLNRGGIDLEADSRPPELAAAVQGEEHEKRLGTSARMQCNSQDSSRLVDWSGSGRAHADEDAPLMSDTCSNSGSKSGSNCSSPSSLGSRRMSESDINTAPDVWLGKDPTFSSTSGAADTGEASWVLARTNSEGSMAARHHSLKTRSSGHGGDGSPGTEDTCVRSRKKRRGNRFATAFAGRDKLGGHISLDVSLLERKHDPSGGCTPVLLSASPWTREEQPAASPGAGAQLTFLTGGEELGGHGDKVVGIITMEDVIEELLQEEIYDETDVTLGNPTY